MAKHRDDAPRKSQPVVPDKRRDGTMKANQQEAADRVARQREENAKRDKR